MSKVSLVASLVKCFVAVICLQHLFLGSERHGVHPFLLVGFVGMVFFPLEMCTWPSICRRFLFFPNARTDLSEKVGDRSGWVCRRYQCLLIALWIGGRCLWYVVVKGVLSEDVLGLPCNNASRGTPLAFPVVRLFLSWGNPCRAIFLQSLQWLRSHCPYGMLLRWLLGWYEP